MKVLELKKDSWGDNTQYEFLKDNYTAIWKNLFDLANIGDLDKPLTRKILSSPNHKITQYLLYLYSMESFIY